MLRDADAIMPLIKRWTENYQYSNADDAEPNTNSKYMYHCPIRNQIPILLLAYAIRK